jgi:hypothetical protein
MWDEEAPNPILELGHFLRPVFLALFLLIGINSLGHESKKDGLGKDEV